MVLSTVTIVWQVLISINNSFTIAFGYELQKQTIISPEICCRITLRNLNAPLCKRDAKSFI